MSALKLAGMVMIALSGVASALFLNKKAEQELKEVSAWIELLKYITEQIASFAMPISEILSKCDEDLLLSCGLTRDIGSGVTFKELVRHRKERDRENGKIIRAFAENFGRNDRGEQIKDCEYYIRLMESRRVVLSEKLPKQKKVNLTLCISSALALIIILI